MCKVYVAKHCVMHSYRNENLLGADDLYIRSELRLACHNGKKYRYTHKVYLYLFCLLFIERGKLLIDLI